MLNLKKINKSSESLKIATMINAGSKYTVVLCNLMFNAILSRILTPNDYGIVAVLTVFTNFFALFSDMGIGTAIVQNKELTQDDENRIFTFSLFLGVVLAVMFSLLSVVLVRVYNNSIYYVLGPFLGMSLAIHTFNMVPNASIMKKKRFLLAGARAVIVNVLCYGIAIFLAIMGAGCYAIVAQSVCSALFIFLWNLRSTELRVDFCSIKNSIKKIWGFSSYQFGFSVVNYFSRNLDNLLAGYFFGSQALGYYDKAYRLMRYPVDNFSNVITPAMQPILSDYQKDVKYIMEKYNKVVKFLSVIAVYITGVCFFGSKEIVLLFFGTQWEKSVECFHLLSLSLVFQMVGGISGSIYQSVNRTKVMFWSGIIGSVITVSSILIGFKLGTIESMAFCYTIGFIINFIKSQIFLSKFCFQESVWNLTKIYIPEILIFAIIFIVMQAVPTLDSLVLSFALKLIICTLVYVILLIITKEYKIIVELLPSKLKHKLKSK